jgi:hypothetical protein
MRANLQHARCRFGGHSEPKVRIATIRPGCLGKMPVGKRTKRGHITLHGIIA